MISKAIYSILNVSAITDLVNDISPVIARPNVQFPYIVFNEKGNPEDSKDGYDIINHSVQIDIYTEK